MQDGNSGFDSAKWNYYHFARDELEEMIPRVE